MSTRWFGTLRESKHAYGQPAEEGFWRAWLATGARRVPIDRRRARGADAHLKKILVGGPSGAVDFSSAMARQAVDEALHGLPPQHKQVVKLAYIGGLTNREIAHQLGLSVSGVRRALRASLATIGAHFETGRAKGRRAIQGVLFLSSWRRLGDAHAPSLDQVVQTGVVAAMAAAAAALLVSHQSPSHVVTPHQATHAAAVGSAGSRLLPGHRATFVAAGDPVRTTAPLAATLVAAGDPVRTTAPLAAAANPSGLLPAHGVKVQPPAPLPVSVTPPPLPSSKPLPAVTGKVHLRVHIPVRLPPIPPLLPSQPVVPPVVPPIPQPPLGA
jgi:DNA-binding CsgD family transcriptional regulator